MLKAKKMANLSKGLKSAQEKPLLEGWDYEKLYAREGIRIQDA